MNREIQLHDCGLSDVTHDDGSTSVVLPVAYIHESSGIPGHDPGLLWHQSAKLTFANSARVFLLAKPPTWIYTGHLRIGQTLHEGFIPASGCFSGETEFCVTLSTEDGKNDVIFTVQGDGVTIELFGERSAVEVFDETPRRSI